MGVRITRGPSGETKMELDGKSVNQAIEDNEMLKKENERLGREINEQKTVLSFLPKWLRTTLEIVGIASAIYFIIQISSLLYGGD